MQRPDARRALLSDLIDHAPMFPPAALPVEEALAEDARAFGSEHAFMLGRLVWPASRLAELPDLGRGISAVFERGGVILGGIEAAEVRWPGDLDEWDDLAPEVYVEVPVGASLEQRLDRLAAGAFRAKVRCGGASVPSSAELARFVAACRERSLPFKATAGLHHAVRTNGEHGFMNLLAAAAFAGDEEAALDERDRGAFSLTPDGFVWRNRSASAAELERMRHEVLHSIGSCSFFEPVEELEALGVLPL